MELRWARVTAVGVAVAGLTVVAGCSGSGGGDPKAASEVVAQSSSLPDGGDISVTPVGRLVEHQAELASTWSEFGFHGDPTVAVPDDGVLLFIGTVESGSCPSVVESVSDPPGDVEADVMVTLATRTGGADSCTTDARPVTFVLSLPDEPMDRAYVRDDGRGRYVDL